MNNELLAFDTPGLCATLNALPAEELDALPYGVIGFDASGHIQRYNAHESKAAMFDPKVVVGQHVFVELAPCYNNYLVAPALMTPLQPMRHWTRPCPTC